MTEKIDTIIEELKSLTLLEGSELVKQLEEIFNVDTSTMMGGGGGGFMMAPPSAAPEKETSEEKKEESGDKTFDIILEAIPDPADKENRINCFKASREMLSLSIAQAKAFTNSLPKPVYEGISKEEVEGIKKQLEESGAKIKIV